MDDPKPLPDEIDDDSGHVSDPRRFSAEKEDIVMLGKYRFFEDRTTPEQKAINAENAAAIQRARDSAYDNDDEVQNAAE